MSFWSSLFGGTHAKSIACIDIGSDSIGMGYAFYRESDTPRVVYTLREPIEMRNGEKPEAAMLRTLQKAGEKLIREGAPELFRASGSGTADTILTSISAPWQETKVRVEELEEKTPFTFTHDSMDRVLARASRTEPGRVLVDASPTSVLLNGYTSNAPYGKQCTRASVTVLTSTITEAVSLESARVLRTLFHTRNILLIAGASVRYQSVQVAFPHERDYLILDGSGPEVSLALVRHGHLAATIDLKGVIRNETHWPREVRIALKEIGQGFPLPHVIFMIGSEERSRALIDSLATPDVSVLWLSNDTPRVTRITPSHVHNLVRHTGGGYPDLILLLMALYGATLSE